MLEELPSPLDFNMIKEERNGLIKVFRENPLGNRWIMCIEHEDGIKKIAKYEVCSKSVNMVNKDK